MVLLFMTFFPLSGKVKGDDYMKYPLSPFSTLLLYEEVAHTLCPQPPFPRIISKRLMFFYCTQNLKRDLGLMPKNCQFFKQDYPTKSVIFLLPLVKILK